jgi:signal peptidase II
MRTRQLAAPLTLALAILIADRVSKMWIDKHISMWDVRAIVPGFINIIHAENSGMAFSLLSTASQAVRSFVLIGLAASVLAVVAVMLWRSVSSVERWALASVLGGAVGNLWDRIARGTVTDFVDVYYGDWHWATFNVADSAITVGALILALHMLVSPNSHTGKSEAPAARVP